MRDFEFSQDPNAEVPTNIEEECNGLILVANPYKLVAKGL